MKKNTMKKILVRMLTPQQPGEQGETEMVTNPQKLANMFKRIWKIVKRNLFFINIAQKANVMVPVTAVILYEYL